MKQPSILQYLKSLVVFFMELTWIKVVQCRKNLCNEVNHTKTSHDRFGEVFCNACSHLSNKAKYFWPPGDRIRQVSL